MFVFIGPLLSMHTWSEAASDCPPLSNVDTYVCVCSTSKYHSSWSVLRGFVKHLDILTKGRLLLMAQFEAVSDCPPLSNATLLIHSRSTVGRYQLLGLS